MELESSEESKNQLITEGILSFLNKNFIERVVHEKLIKKLTKKILKKEKDISDLKDKIWNQEREIRQVVSEKDESIFKLDWHTKYQTYFESKIFNNYVFGDNLPELKVLYTFLKKTGAYYDYWGTFCHSIQKESELHFELRGVKDKMTNKDIGYFLHRLRSLYSYDVFSYESWLYQRVIITSTHGKKVDLPDYYKKYIREYKDVYNAPPQIEEIDKVFKQIGIS